MRLGEYVTERVKVSTRIKVVVGWKCSQGRGKMMAGRIGRIGAPHRDVNTIPAIPTIYQHVQITGHPPDSLKIIPFPLSWHGFLPFNVVAEYTILIDDVDDWQGTVIMMGPI